MPPLPVWYIALRPFDPRAGDRWQDYVRWSGLSQLIEVVSLDVVLCPPVIDPLTPEDWEHNVQADYLISFFTDLDYVLRRTVHEPNALIMAAMREPTAEDWAAFADPRFEFVGFDLVEKPGLGISALANCGGWPGVLNNRDLNQFALLPTLDLARSTQTKLKSAHPDEPHADCHVWALWRLRR